ncbi:hypothetical protein HRbin26_02171 [bacterium HR26]|nr:hypothetical protein HRbin26_02171 [bacterium HR26]
MVQVRSSCLAERTGAVKTTMTQTPGEWESKEVQR